MYEESAAQRQSSSASAGGVRVQAGCASTSILTVGVGQCKRGREAEERTAKPVPPKKTKKEK